ncbi:MAG TPA: hypothetical protein VH834_12330 [Solirubrobacteraceae bacterium]|jgi:hypothetical protein
MGRFQRSERGGGQPDPQEALRRAREAVTRERVQRDEAHTTDEDTPVEDVEDALRERDEDD